MTDIIERLRIESRREPHEPIWLDAIDEIEALRAERDELRVRLEALITAQQPTVVDEVKEPDLWRCTVCGRVGTVGRCCGEETREPVNHAVLSEENSND